MLPKLRFPEFREGEEWIEKTLEEKFEFQDGYAFSSSHFSSSAKRGKQVIRITDINNKNKNTDKVYVSDSLIHDLNLDKYFIKKGDLLLSLTGAAGFNFFFWDSEDALANQRTMKISPKNEKDVALTRLLEPLIHAKINAFGSGQNNNLSKEILKQIRTAFPKPDEQQKIADFLSTIDDLIDAQSQKLDALEAHKKGLTQQLFPSEGETSPKLRFPEFQDAGAWLQKQVKDVCQLQAGKFVSAAEINGNTNNGLYPCYGANGLRGYTKSYTHTGKYALIGRQGALCGNVVLATGQFHATEHAVVATPKGGVDTDWLFYMLTHSNLNQYATGQAQPGLSVENLEKVNIQIPKTENEQQKIAGCLSSIDKLIIVQTQKLAALKAHKKGLMQQLFPSTSDIN